VYPAQVVAFTEIGEDGQPVVRSDVAARAASPHRGERPLRGHSLAAKRKADRNAQNRREGRPVEIASPDNVPDTVDTDVVTTADDLAAVVVRQTLKGIASGALKPTLRDGISAQALLDKRAEKAADRQFMLNLAMAMAGGGHAVPQRLLPPPADPGDDAIEGDFTELNLAPSHLRAE
jgi:hypothetical protein